jgi:SCY1-like protein 1
LWTVFVNEESGEWKLGGVEYMTAIDTLYNSLPSTFQVYQPPEAKESAKPVTKW